MNKKLLLLSLLLAAGLFFSCSSDDSEDKTEPPIVIKDPLPITITELSSEFLVTGQNLEIKGTNLANKDYPTVLLINDTEKVSAKEITDTKIVVPITDAIKAGTNSVKIQINKTLSARLNFYVMKKGWNKLNGLGNYDIHTSNVFDDSNSIFSFADSDIRDLSALFIVGFYVLNIIDANVDAALSQFNVSEKLAFKPAFIKNDTTANTNFGFALNYTF